MDNKDEKWIELLKEKLDNYDPGYNAAHWSGLADKLPASGSGAGGFMSGLASSVKILLVSTAVVVTTVVGVYLLKPDSSEKDLKKNEQKVMPADSMIQQEEPVNKEKVNEEKDSIYKLKTDDNREEKSIEIKETNEPVAGNKNRGEELNGMSEAGNSQDEQMSNVHTAGANYVNSNTDKSQTQSGVFTGGRDNVNENRGEKAIATSEAKTDMYLRESEAASVSEYKEQLSEDVFEENILNVKLKSRSLETGLPSSLTVRKPKKNNKGSGAETKSSFAVKKHAGNKPFYFGLSYSGYYSGEDYWQQHKYLNLFGMTFEKYVFPEFSVSFNPKVSFNSIYRKQVSDIVIPIPDDSLGITRYKTETVDSSEFYSGKLSFIELPLVLNYDIYSHNNNKLSASLGVVGKYTFSMSSGELTDTLKTYNNKFTFPQSGVVSLRYRHQLKGRFFITVEPFWEFPLKKEPDIFNHSYWGLNVSFMVEFKRRQP